MMGVKGIRRRRGNDVNLETDILGKYVLRQHELENETKNSSGVSMEMIVN